MCRYLALLTISGGISGLRDARDARDEVLGAVSTMPSFERAAERAAVRDARDEVLGAVSTMPSFERPAERAAKDDFGSASIDGGGSGAPAVRGRPLHGRRGRIELLAR